METIFLTIHDLTLDARIKYCSDSVEEILGYKPHEVKGKSCWDYFHPDEIPFAKAIHGRGLDLDKAAALNYCRIKNKEGQWIGCECTFTVVYDVLVASTAIYKAGEKAQKRAVDGASIRRVFSSSPRDPRYHMLSFIANKFNTKIDHIREPRAAIVLNRFTRTSTIMFATNGVEQILGFTPAQLVGRSFYYCIAENCLADAISTVESAKHNDSIAYLRFYFRDPTLPENTLGMEDDSEEDEDEEGGVELSRSSRQSSMTDNSNRVAHENGNMPNVDGETPAIHNHMGNGRNSSRDDVVIDGVTSRTSSNDTADHENGSRDQIFDQPHGRAHSSASSLTPINGAANPPRGVLEVEAVVSCTSDGMILVLRRARPLIAETATPDSVQPQFPNGLFASPWATTPVLPDGMSQASSAPDMQRLNDPVEVGFMSAIRDVAVFAWSLTGINGAVVEYAKGAPTGEAVPPGGLPVWDPNAPIGQNENHNGFSGGNRRPIPGMGGTADEVPLVDGEKSGENPSSDDEVVWKRVPEIPAFKKPKRRAHRDAFGTDEEDSVDNEGVQTKKGRKLENGVRHDSSRSF